MKTLKLIFLGPPGAGKGTQAVNVASKWGMAHISTGDMLRQSIKNKESLGLKAEEYMNKGELVPDNIVISIVMQKIGDGTEDKGFVLDGFPRTLNQAKELDAAIKQKGINLDAVLYFETSEEVILKRLSGRRVCKNCGMNYHIFNMPPKIDNVCDKCAGHLYQRDDDKPSAIYKRLEVYKNQTAPLLDYYRKANLLKTINGDLEVKEAFEEITKQIVNRR
jgi:adenylate kinase